MKCYNCSKEIEEVDVCPYCEKNQIYEVLDFNVKGTTFENEKGKDIQKEIRKIFLEYERNGCFEKYSGYTNSEIKEFATEVAEFEDAQVEMTLKEDEYQGKPCIKVYIKQYNDDYCHIGYMPKGLVKTYLKLKKSFKEIKMNISLVGGKIKQLEYDYITEKDKVEIVELTYGFEVSLIFYNDLDKYKEQVEKKKQETIEKWEKMKREDEQQRQSEIGIRKTDIITNEQEKYERIKQEEFEKKQKRSNIMVYTVITIISIPFVWLLWEILSFVFWILF